MKFGSMTVDSEGQDKLLAFADAFNALASGIEDHVAPSRERSLALTALEEAGMWLSRAVALQHEVKP